jgi:dUTP pyrophosphatase
MSDLDNDLEPTAYTPDDDVVGLVCASDLVPVKRSNGAAGYDIKTNVDIEVPGGKTVKINTGIKMSLPYGWECQVRPRSSFWGKFGLLMPNAPGTIDSDYRGEIAVQFFNPYVTTRVIPKGSYIAQLVFARHEIPQFALVEQLDVTSRGEGGFGSTDDDAGAED